jgi:hypothetical protein
MTIGGILRSTPVRASKRIKSGYRRSAPRRVRESQRSPPEPA